MNLLLYMFYPLVGVIEWYLALRRTLACVRRERSVLVSIVFIENLLGLAVLQNFITSGNWLIAIFYSMGAALGALLSLRIASSESSKT